MPGKVCRELERLDIEPDAYGRWARGECDPSARHLRQMVCGGYDVPGILTGEELREGEVRPVRCRDCGKQEQSLGDARLGAVWCRKLKTHMPEDGYCCYGERKYHG